MTNEKYTLMQTNKERAIVARSAHGRKSGARSRKCSLSTDGLTRKEWERRNGPMFKYNPDAPITYAKLRTLPKTTQREIITHIVSTYEPRLKDFKAMLNCSHQTYYVMLEKAGVDKDSLQYTPTASAMSDKWLEFITRPGAGEVPSQMIVPASTPAPVAPAPTPAPVAPAPVNGKLVFTGSTDNIFALLGVLLAPDGNYSIDLSYSSI